MWLDIDRGKYILQQKEKKKITKRERREYVKMNLICFF